MEEFPKYDTSCFYKELDLIQSCISRMSFHSLAMKVLAIMIVLPSVFMSWYFPLKAWVLATVLLIICWALDAYYLKLERQYRKLHEWVVQERSKGNIENAYDMNVYRFKDAVSGIGTSQVVFYVVLIVLAFFGYQLQ